MSSTIRLVSGEEDLSNFSPEQLRNAITKNSNLAVELGTLVTFPSEIHTIRDDDMKVDFAVRVASNLSRKPTLTSKPSGFDVSPTDKEKDPFMPPFEPGLIVGKLDAHHRLLLNKYNVVSDHVLITTSEMEHQFTPIKKEAFGAIHRILVALNGLAFFNRGSFSGASQPHKHYQIIPRQISADIADVPITKAIMDYIKLNKILEGETFSIPHFPFKHAIAVSNSGFSPVDLEDKYKAVLKFLEIEETGENVDLSYNWLTTLNWMLLIPRVKENYEEPISQGLQEMKLMDFSKSLELLQKSTRIPINALGFSGTLFVKTATALAHIESTKPSVIISQVAAFK